MKTSVYIDGQSGTTGLQIFDRIAIREDLNLMKIDEDKRHDIDERKKYLNSADIVFLCLPDESAIEAVSLIDNDKVKIIDASTAHRTNEDWVYGYPELSYEQREKIKASCRVANPGCHATGFISSVAPLVRMGILPVEYPLTCYSLTGYSGGGKKMIEEYEKTETDTGLKAPGIYGLNLSHKHIPEMQKMTGIKYAPVFTPVVDDYYKGMATTIMLHNRLLEGRPSAEKICEKLMEYYSGEYFVYVSPYEKNRNTIYSNELKDSNMLELIVYGNEEQTSITALFDNLGKGASGAAVQNMNIMLGVPENYGLE